jgi:hypothetical protein
MSAVGAWDLELSRNAADFLAFPHQSVVNDLKPMLLAGRVAVKADARTFDAPLGAFAAADEQLAVRPKLDPKALPFPFCSDERVLIQRIGLRHWRAAFNGSLCLHWRRERSASAGRANW